MECSGAMPPAGGGAPVGPGAAQQAAVQLGAAGGGNLTPTATGYDPATVLAELADATARLQAAVNALAGSVGASNASPAPATNAIPPGPIPAPTTATVSPAPTTSTTPGTIVAGRSTTGATLLQPQARAAGSPTSGIVAGSAADAQLLDGALRYLRTSPTGASILSQVEARGVRAQVLDDSQFDAMGQQGAAAFYDTSTDTMYVRRTWLQEKPDRAALVIGHELVHALDDIDGLGNGWLQGRLQQLAASGQSTQATVQQAAWEGSIAREARAYTLQGQVMRELGQLDPTRMAGAVAVAANGANDRATYDAVFRTLVQSREGGYNPEGRSAEPFLM